MSSLKALLNRLPDKNSSPRTVRLNASDSRPQNGIHCAYSTLINAECDFAQFFIFRTVDVPSIFTRIHKVLHLCMHMYCVTLFTDTKTDFTVTVIRQVAQLSQRNRAARWFSFGWVVGDGVNQIIFCTKPCPCQKTKSIDLLHDKSTFTPKTVTLHF